MTLRALPAAALALALLGLVPGSGAQVPGSEEAVLAELGSLPGPLRAGTLGVLPYQVTLRCSELFQPTPGATMRVDVAVNLSEPWGLVAADPANHTVNADLVACGPGAERQVRGNVTVLLGNAPAFAAATVTLAVTATSGDKSGEGSDTSDVEAAFAPGLAVSVGRSESRVPPGGNLTIKVNAVNSGNAAVTATAQLGAFEGTGNLRRESFTLTFPAPQRIASAADGEGSTAAIFEVVLRTPSGGLFLGESARFTFNVTAVAEARPERDGGSGEVEYTVLVQGEAKGDGGKKKKGLPGPEGLVLLTALGAAVLLAGRRRGAA